jgi:2-phosphoglycerate kinase
MPAENSKRSWTVLVIGGGAAVGKTTAANAVAARYGVSVLPVDVIWLALKAATNPASHPELHYFDPPDEEILGLTPEHLCERHIKSASAISDAMHPVVEYHLWEQSPVVLEGAWITPALAGRWTREYEAVRAVFIHQPDAEGVLAAIAARRAHRRGPQGRELPSGQDPSPRQQVSAEVHWRFGNWVREQALAEGIPVVEAPPHATLAERLLAAIQPGLHPASRR